MNTFKIEIDGKSYVLLFGYTCYKLFMTRCFQYKDTYLTEEGELTGLGLTNLFHCAYLNYCYDKGTQISLTYDQVAEWLDQNMKDEEGQKMIAEALEVWAATKEIKKLREDVEKKSQNGVEQALESPTSQT